MQHTKNPQHLTVITDTSRVRTRNDKDLTTLKLELKETLEIIKAPNGSEAYFLHIEDRANARRDTDIFSEHDYFRYFVDMVKYFTAPSQTAKRDSETLSIGSFIKYVLEDLGKHRGDKSPLKDSKSYELEKIADEVFCMLGSWLSMESYFRENTQIKRPIERTIDDATKNWKPAIECSLDELLYRCPAVPCVRRSNVRKPWQSSSAQDTAGGTKTNDSSDTEAQIRQIPGGLDEFLPRGDFDPSLDLEETSVIAASELNLYTLKTFAAVDVHWTTNLARHLLLSKNHGRSTVEVFSLASALSSAFPEAMSDSLVREVKASYVGLFRIDLNVGGCNTISKTTQVHDPSILSPHRSIAERMILRSLWCWCRECSYCRASCHAFSLLQRERRDQAIWFYVEPSSQRNWKPETFPSLWPRIMALREYQNRARPWNLRSLFRDRRDTPNWWGMMCVFLAQPVQISMQG